MLSSAKRKAEELSNEGSSDAVKLTSPWASPVKSRACREEEERKEEEEEASNGVSPIPVMWRCRTRPATKGR